MLYFRQILIMLVSLYTVRVVLSVLGTEDYGIYNVVAGVVVMFGFISTTMATASQRYFSYAMGQGDIDGLNRLFGITLTIYLILIVAVVVLAETVGLWFVSEKLVVPDERLLAAKWVYHFSIASFVVNLFTAPYMAAIIAHEDMTVYAWASIIEAVLKLVVVLALKVLTFDKLSLYGALLFVVACINTVVYRIYCRRKYPECLSKIVWDSKMIKEMLSFSGWNLFGSAVGVFNWQLVGIVLNQFCGATVNAARALSLQINSAVSSFSSNFSMATRPQIIKYYAANQKKETDTLVFRSCKMTYFLTQVFTLPLIAEMPAVLTIWLKNVPEYTIIFSQLALVDALITSVSFPLMTLAQATGKIKRYQGVVGGVLLCNLPAAYIILRLGFAPWVIAVGQVVITIIATFLRFMIVSRIANFSLRQFILKVIFPLVSATLFSCLVPFLFLYFFEPSILRMVCNIICTVIICVVSVFFLALDKNERRAILTMTKKKLSML